MSRRDIEKRLRIKAYDIYGLSEIMGPGVAMECEEQDGLHIYPSHFECTPQQSICLLFHLMRELLQFHFEDS